MSIDGGESVFQVSASTSSCTLSGLNLNRVGLSLLLLLLLLLLLVGLLRLLLRREGSRCGLSNGNHY